MFKQLLKNIKNFINPQTQNNFVIRQIKIPKIRRAKPTFVQRVFVNQGEIFEEKNILLEIKQKSWFSKDKVLIKCYLEGKNYILIEDLQLGKIEIIKINIVDGQVCPQGLTDFEAMMNQSICDQFQLKYFLKDIYI
ncbi:hypothetical protein ABPG72_022569 [Tetrahymena utriculariae]